MAKNRNSKKATQDRIDKFAKSGFQICRSFSRNNASTTEELVKEVPHVIAYALTSLMALCEKYNINWHYESALARDLLGRKP